MRSSLRGRILSWTFIPTAIILLSVAGVSMVANQRVTENLVLERDRDLTVLSAKLLATELESYTDPLADQFVAVFDGVVVFGKDGTILTAEPEAYQRWRPTWFRNLVDQPTFQSDGPVISDVIDGGPQGEKLIVVVMPTAGSGHRAIGGIAGLYRLDPTADNRLFKSIERLHRGESNPVYLVDGSGRVIYHTDPEQLGADYSNQPVVAEVMKGHTGVRRTHDQNGEETVASFTQVPGTSWGLVTQESWSSLTATSQRYRQYSLVLLGLGIVAPTVIVAVGLGQITNPINNLIRAAQDLASGHFDQRIATPVGGELAELAEQFNRMAAHLQESYAHLERKVADRTRELATLNAIVAQVSHSLDLQEILTSALDEVLPAVGMETGQAYRLSEDGEALVLMAHRGLSEAFVHRSTRISLEAAGAFPKGAGNAQPLVWQAADQRRREPGSPEMAEGIHLTVSIPLIAQSRIVGAILLGSRHAKPLTSDELALLAAIGQQIGVAVENARLHEQAQQLAVMKERNRLACDLHDSVTQALYGVTLYSEAAARQLRTGDVTLAEDHLREIRCTAQESLREMRLLIFELRLPSLRRRGLSAALEARLEAVEGRLGLSTEFSAQGNGPLPAALEEGLYRIAQEALNNALRHARASSVAVQVVLGTDRVSIEVRDDGVGFDPAACCGGLGLDIMRERIERLGGRLNVWSEEGKGTRIQVEVDRP